MAIDDCMPQTCMVYVGIRKDGCLGYFEDPGDLPEGWDLQQEKLDIMDIMQANHLEKSAALRMMNQHWRP